MKNRQLAIVIGAISLVTTACGGTANATPTAVLAPLASAEIYDPTTGTFSPAGLQPQ